MPSPYKYKNRDADEKFGRAMAFMAMNADSPATANYETPAGLFLEVLRLEPDCADPYLFAALGEALLRLNRHEAIGHLERAIHLNQQSGVLDSNRPFLAMTYRNLGFAEFQQGKPRYAQAHAYFRKAISAHPAIEPGLAKILIRIENELGRI